MLKRSNANAHRCSNANHQVLKQSQQTDGNNGRTNEAMPKVALSPNSDTLYGSQQSNNSASCNGAVPLVLGLVVVKLTSSGYVDALQVPFWAKLRAPLRVVENNVAQITKVDAEMARMTGTNTADTRSLKAWIGAFAD